MKKLGVFLFVFGGTALFNRAELSSVDEGFIFNTTAALVEKQSFQMDEQLSGRKYSRFSPLPSFFAAPFYFVGDRVMGRSDQGPNRRDRDWLLLWTGLSSCVLTAWTAVALFGLLRSLNYSEETVVWTSLLWAFGTLAFPYSSSLFHQVMATLLMVYVVRFNFAEKIAATAICTALLLSIQLTLAATVSPLFLRDRGQWNRQSLFGLSIGVLGGFGLHVVSNVLRGDHWLHGAYETETFTTPTFVGTVGLFFSSGKGLLWFAPLVFVGLVMLLPFANRRPDIGRPLLFAVACHCLVVIHWWAWHGSLSWGPRLLLPILPLMMIPIADLIERRHELPTWQPRLIGSVAGVSVLINVWAATQPMIGFLEHIPNGSMSEWVFIPSLSPLLRSIDGTLPWKQEGAARWFALVHVAVLTAGAYLCRRTVWKRINWSSAAPWRSLAVLLIIPVSSFLDALESHRQLAMPTSGEWRPLRGALQFPIRGVYRIEAHGLEADMIQIGSQRLSALRPSADIEAPPMTVRVAGRNTGFKPITFWWTLPGDSQYRSPIPRRHFKEDESAHEAHRPWQEWNAWNWLLLLLAVPLYFDWLLGGRRMKEPNEFGTEANK